MKQYDFFETPVNPYTLLVEMAEVEIHVRDTETMEQSGVRGIVAKSLDRLPEGLGVKLNCYGRLGVRIQDPWFIQVLEELDDASLSTDHLVAQSMDMEQSLKSPEQFKKSRYRKDKEA